MEKIPFNFPEGMTREDQLNRMMEFIVNRAAGFNKDNFDSIIMQQEFDGVKSFMLYRTVSIIAMIKNMPIYVYESFGAVPWMKEKNENVHFVSERKLDRMIKKGKPLMFSTRCYGDDPQCDNNGIYIFDGITESELTEIATTLYDYQIKE